MLVAAAVELDDVEAVRRERLRERLPERRRDAAHLAHAGRVEARAVPQHAANRLVLPRRHLLEHLEVIVDVAGGELSAAEQPLGRVVARLAHELRRARDLGAGVLEPQLRRLVHGLEEQLVPVHPFLGRLLEREELVRAQVPLVVRGAVAGEDRLREVLDRHRRGAYFPSR